MKGVVKNRTIFSKMLFGFGLILMLTFLMGGLLFYSLRNVSGVLTRIVEQSAPSIRFPTAVERYALRTILDEKNYLLLEKKEIHQQAMKDIQAIYSNLDEVDKIANKFNDEVLLQKSRDVRQAVKKYQSYYNRGVVLLEENQKLADEMRVLGSKVNEIAHTYTLKYEKIMEVAIAKGAEHQKYIDNLVHLCFEIEKEGLEVRRQEKNYFLYREPEYLGKLKEHIANLMELYEEVNVSNLNQLLIAEIRGATQEYLSAVEKYDVNSEELREILDNMHNLGVEVQETAFAVQEAGWLEMENSKKIALLTEKRAFLFSELIGIIVIIVGFLGAFFIARGISLPIKELVQSSDRLSKGDFNVRVKVKDGDEIGFLACSFNKMVENLGIFQEKIQAQNEELMISNEELESINEELRQSNEEVVSMSKKLIEANEDIIKAKEAAERKAAELARFNKVAVGRELKMIELKKRVKKLEEKFKESG